MAELAAATEAPNTTLEFETLRDRLDYLAQLDGAEDKDQPHSLSSYGKARVLEELVGGVEALDLREVWDAEDLHAALGRPLEADYEAVEVTVDGALGVELAPLGGAAVVCGAADGADIRPGDFLVAVNGATVADALGGSPASEANFGAVVAFLKAADRPAAVSLLRELDPGAAPAPPRAGVSLRAATHLPAVRNDIKRCVSLDVSAADDDYDADLLVPREMGFQRIDLGWPAKRDDADNFWMLGHSRVSAMVAATLLRAAAPRVDWFVVACHTYACVLGNCGGRGRPVLVDPAAATVGYDARAYLKKVGAYGTPKIFPVDRGAYLDRMLDPLVAVNERRKRVPRWAPVNGAMDFQAKWESGAIRDADKPEFFRAPKAAPKKVKLRAIDRGEGKPSEELCGNQIFNPTSM